MKNRQGVITAKEARALDVRAQKRYGVCTTLLLMENAGRAVAEEALKIIKDRKVKVAVFCGRGNNGGDGFCAARHLLTKDIKPEVFLAGKIPDVRNEARVNLGILLKLRQKIFEVNADNLYLVKNKIPEYGLIIDALLGVGLKGEVGGIFRDLITLINTSPGYILSVDIPSGLDAANGGALGRCIKADKTVTFVARKSGMLKGDGQKNCGRIIVKDIGIPL